MAKKRSLFERLTGAVTVDDEFDTFDDEYVPEQPRARGRVERTPVERPPVVQEEYYEDPTPAAGQLPVDVFQTPNEIVVKAFVAGVKPDELDLAISREMVVISGTREDREAGSDEDYFIRELFWGSFSRTILLPQEIDVDSASAGEKNGLLTIILPKLDKAKQTKIKVKAG